MSEKTISEKLKELYGMEPLDRITYSIFDVWRVPGGWLFGCDGGEGRGMVLEFVPYSKN